MAYELFYWPEIQGRGEFVRLALEEAAAPYVDVARSRSKGVDAMMKLLRSHSEAQLPFAPPILRDGDVLVSHVANILMYLGPKLGLAPRDEKWRPFANGLQLTITDMVAEVARYAPSDFDCALLRGPERRGEGAREGVPGRADAQISRLFRAGFGSEPGRSRA